MDLAFEAVGSNGKFQKIISLTVILVATMTLFSSSAFPFLTNKPIMLCKEKGNELYDFRHCYHEDWCKYSTYEYIKDEKNSLNNWTFEFDLYCEKGKYVTIIGSSFFFGGMIGSIALSSIPDIDGRLRIYRVLLIANFVLHISFMLGASVWHIIITNFISGFASYSYSMSTLIVTEYLNRNTAGLVMSINNAIFPVTGVLNVVFFYYVNNWRLLFFITSCISALIVFLVYKYFLESARWLNSKNRIVETMQVLKKIAEFNGNEKTYEQFVSVNASKYMDFYF